jgi:hypothetical protein
MLEHGYLVERELVSASSSALDNTAAGSSVDPEVLPCCYKDPLRSSKVDPEKDLSQNRFFCFAPTVAPGEQDEGAEANIFQPDPEETESVLKDPDPESQERFLWGPYLSERQWGTVREDFSQDDNK